MNLIAPSKICVNLVILCGLMLFIRIMNQTDPLALYSKATKPRPAQKSAQAHKPESPTYTYSQPTANHKKSSPKVAGCMTFLVGILIIVVAIVLMSKIL